MNNDSTQKLRGVVELLLENSSRINDHKQKYWHPLSMATYGIDEIMEALDSMCSFRTTMWEKTEAFEKKFAKWQGCQHAIMVNSGSSADLLACFGLTDPTNPRLKPGDEILVPVVTWPTQIWSAKMAGLKVKLVDVDPLTLNMTSETIRRAITQETKALFLVHLMGMPCDMSEIMDIAYERNLVVLEDCCEALGSTYGPTKVGNFGIASTFSFFFAHHMMTMEGGMVCTNDDLLARNLRIMRAHGWLRNVNLQGNPLAGYDLDPRYAFVNWGFNLRPTELQAGFGLHQLDKLDGWNAFRRDFAATFYRLLPESNRWLFAPEHKPLVVNVSWFALPIMLADDAPFTKHDLTCYLERNGVETRPIVTGNVARHPVAKLFPEFNDSFPGADKVHQNGFYIGLPPIVSKDNIAKLLRLLKNFQIVCDTPLPGPSGSSPT